MLREFPPHSLAVQLLRFLDLLDMLCLVSGGKIACPLFSVDVNLSHLFVAVSGLIYTMTPENKMMQNKLYYF